MYRINRKTTIPEPPCAAHRFGFLLFFGGKCWSYFSNVFSTCRVPFDSRHILSLDRANKKKASYFLWFFYFLLWCPRGPVGHDKRMEKFITWPFGAKLCLDKSADHWHRKQILRAKLKRSIIEVTKTCRPWIRPRKLWGAPPWASIHLLSEALRKI